MVRVSARVRATVRVIFFMLLGLGLITTEHLVVGPSDVFA